MPASYVSMGMHWFILCMIVIFCIRHSIGVVYEKFRDSCSAQPPSQTAEEKNAFVEKTVYGTGCDHGDLRRWSRSWFPAVYHRDVA